MREALRRIWYLLNRSRFERELRDDMAAHREMKGEAGPPFGNLLRLREEARDEWGWAWLDRLAQDLRFAVRLLVRSPAFTAAATAVLAFGVGLNLAAFQVFDTVALSWLPVKSPETLVRVARRSPKGTSTALSYPAFDFYRSRSRSLSAALALVYGEVTFGDDHVHHVPLEFVSSEYFDELGTVPLLGRLPGSRDDAADAEPIMVLGERVWRARFGGDPSIVGRTLRINDHPFTVAGIVPATFVGLDDRGAAWIPLTQHPAAFTGSTVLTDETASPVRWYARLRDDVSREAAEAELRPLVNALRQQYPSQVWDDEWLSLRPAGRFVALEQMNGAGIAMVGTLIALVLVTACMNLGLLLLARSLGREREFAIRMSVGATRGRIVRQLVTEHLVIAALGAAAGCVVSAAATRIMLVITGVPQGIAPHFSLRVAAVAAALAVVSSLLFGFTPAVQALKPAPTRLRFRNVLVAVQVGAACVLLILSALLVRGVSRVTQVPLGFEYQRTLLVDPALHSFGMSEDAAGAYWQNLEARIRHLGGVEGVAIASLPPFGNRVSRNRAGTIFHRVTPSYFETMKIPILRGRVFSPAETDARIVSETLARHLWGADDPLGKVYEGGTVVGVSGDARTVRIGDASATECYLPIDPPNFSQAVMVVRVGDRPDFAVPNLLAAARSVDSRVIPEISLLRDELQAKLETPRQMALVTAALGLCALLLAVTGLAGLVSFTVSQRVREIGVRLALGARRKDIVRAVARQFAVPTAIGLAGGAACAALAATVLSRELFGLSRVDPISYGGAALLFGLVTVVAALPSLRRAVRTDPMTALRHE